MTIYRNTREPSQIDIGRAQHPATKHYDCALAPLANAGDGDSDSDSKKAPASEWRSRDGHTQQ
jgi:hypothetical protein